MLITFRFERAAKADTFTTWLKKTNLAADANATNHAQGRITRTEPGSLIVSVHFNSAEQAANAAREAVEINRLG